MEPLDLSSETLSFVELRDRVSKAIYQSEVESGRRPEDLLINVETLMALKCDRDCPHSMYIYYESQKPTFMGLRVNVA